MPSSRSTWSLADSTARQNAKGTIPRSRTLPAEDLSQTRYVIQVILAQWPKRAQLKVEMHQVALCSAMRSL